MFIKKYLNEGFDIKSHKRLCYTDAQQNILDTSFDGEPTLLTFFSKHLNQNIDVYSIFKRKIQLDNRGDSNPVLYALKNEHSWKFNKPSDREDFWRRFTQLLKRFLRNHKNKYDSVIVIPSSNRLNKDIVAEIEKIADEVGIAHISHGGLHTLSTVAIEDAAFKNNSYFRDYWGIEFDEKFDELLDYLSLMDKDNKGKFKYHLIDNMELRKSIMYTLDVDSSVYGLYSPNINDNNILIVDDSITRGQSIKNAIYALTQTYSPKSISVLTMFSMLYDKDGNEIPYDLNDEFIRNK